MGIFGWDSEKNERLTAEHKWDYINLSDFRSHSCWTPFTYVVLYISLLISIACYAIDVFTCSQLLLFDRWSGQIQPVVPLYISRWVFAGCILLSLVLLVFRWIRAVRAIKSGGIAKSYLDPLAVRLQSIRMGQNGRGWRRFLLFTELTKSKKGAEYVALFSYFSFEASLRIILAEGPRQAINAITIASVLQSQFIPNGQHAAATGSSPIAQFFINVKLYAQGNQLRAVVLFGMLFTLLIWIIAALSLVVACTLYVVFLWHHIPSADGGLAGFCKRKIDGRLQKIVDVKVKKALEKEEAKSLGGESMPRIKKQPTLPVLDDFGDDKLPQMPTLNRQNTQATQATVSSQASAAVGKSRPGFERQPTVPDIGRNFARPLPSRTATQSSARSYSSNAPLVGSAAPMGYDQSGRSYSPTELSQVGPFLDSKPFLGRTLTGQTQGSQSSYISNQDHMPLSRQNTAGTHSSSNGRPFPGPYACPARQNTGMGTTPYYQPIQSAPRRQNTNESARSVGDYFDMSGGTPSSLSRNPTFQSTWQSPPGFEPQSRYAQNGGIAQSRENPYMAYNVGIPVQVQGGNSAGLVQPSNFQSSRWHNNLNGPPILSRSGTAPPAAYPYDDSFYDSYRSDTSTFSRPAMPVRAATAGPGA
ncbi:MAG: hypothetical protein LQ340_001874 [Diploschistes diacapsis]|nr:MAG: hypothetical protein LQ340_001874 [Diploschistes diacapsis]